MTSNNTPYIESTGNTVTQNQTQIYNDMGGLDFQIQAGNPILNFIQGDPSSNVIIGDFVPNESDGGSAQMYPIIDEDMTSLPPVPSIQTASVLSTSSLVNQADETLMGPNAISEKDVTVTGQVITPPLTNGPTVISESGQYSPELTSPSIPFLGTIV